MAVHFVTFACRKDIHYAKALVGSIRYFYPDAKVIAILDEDVNQRDTQQLARRGVGYDLIRRHKLYLTGLLVSIMAAGHLSIGWTNFCEAGVQPYAWHGASPLPDVEC